MKKIIMLKGLPASGKSSWAKKLIDETPGLYKRVNRDNLREMIDSSKWSKENEKLIIKIRDIIIKNYLYEDKVVIVDDTNLNPKNEVDLRKIAEEFDADFEIKEFDVPIWTCLERDAKREKPVGSKVIWDMYNQYLAKDNNKKKSEFKVERGKQLAILIDIDGTLAHKCDRGIFDYTKVKGDYCDVVIRDIVNKYTGEFNIIILSGRDDSCKKETCDWLEDNDICHDKIFMRKTGDARSDEIVKEEIYREFIESYYSVFFVLDDRERVVNMWRRIGLKCLQCEYGSF